jgi:hypothetical protein
MNQILETNKNIILKMLRDFKISEWQYKIEPTKNNYGLIESEIYLHIKTNLSIVKEQHDGNVTDIEYVFYFDNQVFQTGMAESERQNIFNSLRLYFKQVEEDNKNLKMQSELLARLG